MAGQSVNTGTGSTAAEQYVPAVAYVRMSTDHQKYSTENQLDVIRKYAEARGLTILRTFEDSGRSGLRLDGREALQSLMAEVQSGQSDFKAILVYDVSRWDRFQDADEGAYHEHVCSRAVQLLVARVTVDEDGLDIDLRHEGLGALASLMKRQMTSQSLPR